ncbi:MAG: DUF4387 family protein [Pseudomonadota bacterium]
MSLAKVADIVKKTRSKNAGPFWLTIDIFCGSDAAFARVCSGLKTEAVAAVLGANTQELKRFDIADLNVVKFSLPRPHIQGSLHDTDMHGASYANLIAELELD